MVFSHFIIPFQCLREQCLAVCASRRDDDDLLTFTRSTAQAWLKQYGNPPKNDKRRHTFASVIGVEKRFDNVGHFIAESNPKIRKRCRTCQSNSIYFCVKCDVYLNPKCFLEYHSKNE